MKGLLHAGVGYMPDDPVCNWVYEKATEWEIPIMCHTGAPSAPLRWRTAPGVLRLGGGALPGRRSSFAHRRRRLVAGACRAAAWLPNVYLDLSLWQKPYRKMGHKAFVAWLRHLTDMVGADKIMFATDARIRTSICACRNGRRCSRSCPRVFPGGKGI